MIRMRNLYGIFFRVSRHQKRGDLRADPNGRKAFPRSDPQNEQYVLSNGIVEISR
jgi:hypothetical protein